MAAWRRPLLLLFLAATLIGAWVIPPDAPAARQSDEGLKRALTTFASARALDAVISAAQGTEFSLQPLGVGLTFAPGQVLDPVNDLVEQFSGLMLAASVSFGVQRLLISAGGHWAVSALLSVLAVAWVAWAWRAPAEASGRSPLPARLLTRALLLMLLVRFAMPLAVLSADAGFRWFMADDYAAGQGVLDRSAGSVRALSPPVAQAPADSGAMDALKRWWTEQTSAGGPPAPAAAASAPALPDTSSRLEQLQRVVGDAVEQLVRLIVVFAMQTLVFPVLTLWVLVALVRRSFER